MIKTNLKTSESEILEKLTNIEQAVTCRLGSIEEKLEMAGDAFQIFHDGLKAYRERYGMDSHLSDPNSVLNRLMHKFRNDKELEFPHRKILDYMISNYQFEKNEFKEVHFSQLVREAHVAKDLARSYLAFLEQKGYIQKRNDGHKIMVKLRA